MRGGIRNIAVGGVGTLSMFRSIGCRSDTNNKTKPDLKALDSREKSLCSMCLLGQFHEYRRQPLQLPAGVSSPTLNIHRS